MKLGLLTDVRFHTALAKLTTQPMPLRVAFKLKGITAKIQEETKKFEDVRQGALERWGSKDHDGKIVLNADNTVKFENRENFQSFVNELNELRATEVEVGSVSVAELGEKVILSAEEVSTLDSLLVE